MALASVAYLRSILELLEQGGGSRGSYLVLSAGDAEPKPENIALRDSVIRVRYSPDKPDLFTCETIPIRKASRENKSFEAIWADHRNR